jgi:hypothetical protein
MSITCNRCNKEKNGIQTGLCEHCGKFGKTDFELAQEWWYELDVIKQISLTRNYLDIDSCDNLNRFEIHLIWFNENKK